MFVARSLLVLLSLLLAASCRSATPEDASDLVLWYEDPAANWNEALPIGNGSMGAMVFGDPATARYQFNEDTLWVGEPHDYAHRGASAHLETIRQLLFAGKQREAEALASREFMSVPLRQAAYQPFGDLLVQFAGHGAATEYRRELDLDAATATTTYVVDGVRFRREAFASHPDGAIVVRLTADRPGALSFTTTLTSPHAESWTKTLDAETLALGGVPSPLKMRDTVHAGAMRFEAHLRVRPEGGECRAEGESLVVSGADAATLVLVPATSFRTYRDSEADPGARARAAMAALDGRTYRELRRTHLADHRALFRRVDLDLGTTDAAHLSTVDRIARFGEGDDPQLAELLFQYGRYLMIASSRPGGQPANLQGLWNESLSPPWESKYTANINVEMNYWGTETCNLAECGEPLFEAVTELSEAGRSTAREHYGARGWVMHHNFDLWRGCAPINASNHGIWPTGGAWLCQHLWWHYLFTGDEEFLATTAYPAMKGAAEFFSDYLVEDPRSDAKWLISGPSNSPENGGLVMGPTMDHQIIRDLFANTAAAAAVLGVDEAFRDELLALRARVAPNHIGQHGQLQEWLEDKDDPGSQHRHVSHLWGLHPGDEITPEIPDLFAAAKQSLLFRGDGGTGWSRGWKVNLWARLRDAEHAYLMLKNFLLLTGSPKTDYQGGGVYPNLFCAHPPFQIDGNFGAASGIAEMLVQSHVKYSDGPFDYRLDLLPALPSAWPTGRVHGLRARGGFEVDLAWEDGRLTEATVHSLLGRRLVVRHGEHEIELPTRRGGTYDLTAELR